MSGIDVKPEGGAVCVTVSIGERTARLRVTPEYAKRLASRLIIAAVSVGSPEAASEPESWLERLQRILGEKP